MASLLSWFRAPAEREKRIDLPSVQIHDIHSAKDKLPRTLKHLLKANHHDHSIIYHDLQFDNHLPHILCSAYLLGADAAHLNHLYEVESKELEPWKESPGEISEDDWRDFLGKKEYQRAYVQFFGDVQSSYNYGYDWKKVVERFMFQGDQPLVNGLIGGLGHPLIHLGYAYEFNNREVGMEALSLACCQYNFLHKYLDDATYTKPAPFSSTSPRELLDKLADDKRLDGLFQEPGFANIEPLFEKHESIVLEYWNAWSLNNPVEQFRESQEAAVALLVSTVAPGTHAYNFFVCHILTTSHAVRVLLPLIPAKFHLSLVRQWWLLVLAVYVAELRPKIDPDYVDTNLGGKGWAYVEDKALNSDSACDAHYVKGEYDPIIIMGTRANAYQQYEQ
ncbi:hypothetical protein DL546_003511 [Coniochaeta pulveracea]|uniref:Uncharacterized protein n=1 Tax=Coniochaeta pulveracea TaxID=177199 RepID=A0A420XZM0_9PEZI|nr:hypothetical protein DL546_003511 [Coniochaeta pulveracea]